MDRAGAPGHGGHGHGEHACRRVLFPIGHVDLSRVAPQAAQVVPPHRPHTHAVVRGDKEDLLYRRKEGGYGHDDRSPGREACQAHLGLLRAAQRLRVVQAVLYQRGHPLDVDPVPARPPVGVRLVRVVELAIRRGRVEGHERRDAPALQEFGESHKPVPAAFHRFPRPGRLDDEPGGDRREGHEGDLVVDRLPAIPGCCELKGTRLHRHRHVLAPCQKIVARSPSHPWPFGIHVFL